MPLGSPDTTFYVEHIDTNETDIVGACCFRHLSPKNRKKTCAECGANHLNTLVNKCNRCRGIHVRRAADEEADFEDVHVMLGRLQWFSRIVFPYIAHHASWTCTINNFDDSRLFFNMFYDGHIQATFHYDLEEDRVTRVKSQGGAAVKAQIDAHFERLQDTMFFLVTMSRRSSNYMHANLEDLLQDAEDAQEDASAE